MPIGAHVDADDPLGTAQERGADVVQFFLSDPQTWKAPTPHPQAAQLQAAGISVFIHSPYVLNVASTNNRIRIPSRKAVIAQAKAAAETHALGLIVHGGHVRQGEDPAVGVDNWRKLFSRQAAEGGFAVPILIENTAGGDGAMARGLDALGRLWDSIGEFDPGFCLDTCHAFASGEELASLVERTKAITGRIDLVHLNSSRDAFGSGRDRHANLADGTIEVEQLVAVCAQAGAPVVVETPGAGQAADISHLRRELGV
ncbi:deoxyribonuclease IV [Actinoalloteichus hymeniacidonis]|uniref:Endonuclease IV n=1 Tax=Actinoalloteichus hymeniacidonis TaxID=340345 RepID=A0AAC9N185_9PSEU|nr:deoxyribonuclease IV [Actinoalloteichus hymeniacidonis]AOS66135.1 Endonuclease IV [Actinoalloteichus hymeniacidonis]MBB5905761.1 deoxyribonuclease-4 [Actinoalloteichus hymeniacidonis]